MLVPSPTRLPNEIPPASSGGAVRPAISSTTSRRLALSSSGSPSISPPYVTASVDPHLRIDRVKADNLLGSIHAPSHPRHRRCWRFCAAAAAVCLRQRLELKRHRELTVGVPAHELHVPHVRVAVADGVRKWQRVGRQCRSR